MYKTQLSKAVIACTLITSLLGPFSLAYANDKHGESQPDEYQIGIFTEIFTIGDYSIDEDRLSGIELKYFFDQNSNFKHFFSSSYSTDNSNTGRSLDVVSIGLGSQYKLTQNSFLEYSLAAAYTQETIMVQLLDRTNSSTYSEFTHRAMFNYGYNFSDDIAGKIFVTQLNSNRGFGLGLSYSF